MKLLTREELSGRQASPEHKRWADLYEAAMEIEEVMKLEKRANAATGGWSNVVVESVAMYSSGRPSAADAAEAEAADHGLAYGGKRPSQHKAKRKRADTREAVLAFHGMYKYVMGENWWYEASTLGPEFDMFLWSLLMVREDMAKLIWSRLEDAAVRAALLAATLYRKWSMLSDIKPHVQAHMGDIAQHFEDAAVGCSKVAMRRDVNFHTTCMERKSRLWQGLTAVDLALLGNCPTYLEQCCSQMLDFRWSGDLHPYNQTLGLYPSVIICLLSGGLLAPTMLTWRDPPAAEAIRPPTQRMEIPEGRKRNDESSTEALDNIFFKLQKVQASHAIAYDSREVREFTSDDLEEMGCNHVVRQESSPWTERYCLFFMCPITIFIIDAMIQITVNITFMNILFTSDPNRQTLTTIEVVLAAQQLSTTVSEMVQAYVDGYRNYWQAGMNWVKMIGIFFFWLGFCGHVLRPYLMGSALVGLDPWLGHCMLLLKSVGLHEHADMAYSISLFFMWMMVLNIISIRKDLGPLVSVFARMGTDMLTFGTIWIILLLGFSCAMHGTGINNDRPECRLPPAGGGLGAGGGRAGDEGLAEGPAAKMVTSMSCWSTWWILRTYYQAFGQPFFEELTTDEANVITVIVCVCMCVCMCVCVCMYVCVYKCTYMHAYINTYILSYIRMYIYIHTYIRICIRILSLSRFRSRFFLKNLRSVCFINF